MFSKLVAWHQDWEREMLDVLEHPERAETAKPGWRRAFARQLIKLTPVERLQLATFSRRYMGWRSYWALVKFIVPFMAAGGLAHLLWPRLPLGWGIALGGVVGMEVLFLGAAVWFNYSKFTGKNRYNWLFKYLGMGFVGGAVGFAFAMTSDDPAVILAKLQKALPMFVGGIVGMVMLISLPVLIVGSMRAREADLLAQDLLRKAEQEKLERQLSETQLRLLRAQIEPHFLFNTLGAVQQLAEDGAPRAAALTADLIAFLRATSSEMRRESNTVREEFQLVQAYLNVMQARLGKRLHYSIDLPEALAAHTVPSMTVLTLAENAIKHGIEPALRGGMVSIAARSEDGDLVIVVADSGAGMAPVPGKGLGLENIRTRIALVHGHGASLNLNDGETGGVVAEMRLPALQGEKA